MQALICPEPLLTWVYKYGISAAFFQGYLRPGNTGNIFLQLSRNIAALQVEKRCWPFYHPPQTLSQNKISLLQVEAACCIKLNWRLLFSTKLATTNFVAWQCLRWVVIRATTLFNLQRNNVALQIAAICCSYYFTFTLLEKIYRYNKMVPFSYTVI